MTDKPPPPRTDATRRPTRAATHRPIELSKLMNLALALEDAGDDAITCDALEELAVDEGGVPRAHMYAAMVMNPELSFAREHDTAFVVCAGGCQEWGSLDVIETLLRAREARLDDGEPAFDVCAVLCHDKCEQAPIVEVHTDSGKALIEEADRDGALDEALSQV